MCTAITYKTECSYFGRNLDLEYSYNETVTVTPRNYSFNYRKAGDIKNHYAIIGMAHVANDYPLYYDAINEKGLAIAGLNFPNNAYYGEEINGKLNISPFEFIPYILCNCSTVTEVRKLLENVNLININFSNEMSLTPLHWIIADKESAITVESVKEGLKVYDNTFGVLTNNPTFENQLLNCNKYMHLSPNEVTDLKKDEYFTRGSGAVGLPGDWSSMSRFVKAVFIKKHARSDNKEKESVGQFFHMLSSVAMPRGCIRIGDKDEITQYSSCCNLDCGLYYYTTYSNRQINCIDIYKENLDGEDLISYPLLAEENIFYQN